jgi:hypothetical protein
VDRHELAELMALRFEVKEMFSITPHFNRGLLRLINSGRLKRLAEAAKLSPVLRQVKRWEERMWLGWTIMTLAGRRSPLPFSTRPIQRIAAPVGSSACQRPGVKGRKG